MHRADDNVLHGFLSAGFLFFREADFDTCHLV